MSRVSPYSGNTSSQSDGQTIEADGSAGSIAREFGEFTLRLHVPSSGTLNR